MEESFILPDWQFIQYILPCFVNLIGQLATNSKTNPNELLAFTRFVHNLIQSYESNLTTKHIKGTPGKLMRCAPEDIPDWACMNISKYLPEQLQELERELEMLVYGTHKRMRKADTDNMLLGQICFRMLKETLRISTFERCQPVIFRRWGEAMLQCVPRMKAAISLEALQQTNSFLTNNLLQALTTLQELAHIVAICNVKPMDELIHASLDLANQKLKLMMGKQQRSSRGNLEKKIFLEIQKLTVGQLLGLATFTIVLGWSKKNLSISEFLVATKMTRSTIVDDAVKKYEAQDWHGLRSLLTPLLSDNDGNDLSLVTFDFIKKSASTCYARAINTIKTKDANRKHFLSLLPVLPVKYCRCCESFTAQLSMCKVCVDNPDFPDVHWFCCAMCEGKVLGDGHLEEHDHFLMQKLGLV